MLSAQEARSTVNGSRNHRQSYKPGAGRAHDLKGSPLNLHQRINPRTVERVAEARLPTEFGEFRISGYRSRTSAEEFVALVRGELGGERPSLVRIHSQCMTG